jgi:excisionase family DNA binding protein
MTITDATERLLTPLEIAERCVLSSKTAYRAIDRGELPAARICSRLRVCVADVEAWITAGRVCPRPVDRQIRPVTAPATNGLRTLLPDRARHR